MDAASRLHGTWDVTVLPSATRCLSGQQAEARPVPELVQGRASASRRDAGFAVNCRWAFVFRCTRHRRILWRPMAPPFGDPGEMVPCRPSPAGAGRLVSPQQPSPPRKPARPGFPPITHSIERHLTTWAATESLHTSPPNHRFRLRRSPLAPASGTGSGQPDHAQSSRRRRGPPRTGAPAIPPDPAASVGLPRLHVCTLAWGWKA